MITNELCVSKIVRVGGVKLFYAVQGGKNDVRVDRTLIYRVYLTFETSRRRARETAGRWRAASFRRCAFGFEPVVRDYKNVD